MFVIFSAYRFECNIWIVCNSVLCDAWNFMYIPFWAFGEKTPSLLFMLRKNQWSILVKSIINRSFHFRVWRWYNFSTAIFCALSLFLQNNLRIPIPRSPFLRCWCTMMYDVMLCKWCNDVMLCKVIFAEGWHLFFTVSLP